MHVRKYVTYRMLFAFLDVHNKTPKVFCLTFGVHIIGGCTLSFVVPGSIVSLVCWWLRMCVEGAKWTLNKANKAFACSVA